MNVFEYKAINLDGKRLNGVVEAWDDRDALNQIKNKELYVVDLSKKDPKEKDVRFRKGVGARNLAIFCRQLSTMLSSGVNLLNALDVLRKQENNKIMSKALNGIYEMVKKGTPLSFCMREYGGIFPDILVNMVEAGEVSGSLEKSFESMAVYFEKEDRLKKKLSNALIYPVVVLVVTLVVLNILLLFVIPTFTGIFLEMDLELPAITRFLILLSDLLQSGWYILLAILFIIVWLVRSYSRTEQGKKALDNKKLQIPIIKKIILNALTARFAGTLSTLLNAGVTLTMALDTTSQVLENVFVKERFEDVVKGVRRGESLSSLVANMKVFPPLLSVMIRTGEESGSIDSVLGKVASFYEDELDNSITKLTAVFEPIIILILGLIVGLVLAAIVIPMFKLYGSVK